MNAPPDSPLLSIIVPVYNEAGTVGAVLARLRSIALPLPREIVVVNDGSTDQTRTVLDDVAPGPDVRIVHAARNGGKGSAIRRGSSEVRGSIVAIQDADLELDPAQIAELVAPIIAGDTEVVYGSRFLGQRPDAPWKTIAANRFLTAVTNLLYGGASPTWRRATR